MSAFIVEDKTINRIVSFLNKDDGAGYTKRRIREELGIDPDTQPELLGYELFLLNCTAVNERYGDGQDEQFRDLTYKFTYVRDLEFAKVKAIKSLQCWRYQCTEGTCDETPLYKIMDEYAKALAERLVSTMPGYEQAVWG